MPGAPGRRSDRYLRAGRDAPRCRSTSAQPQATSSAREAQVPERSCVQRRAHSVSRRSHHTSMATPHVSGTVALMRQANPGLSVDETLDVLDGTAFSDDRYGALPNTRYGAGRIDAYAAVAEASLTSGVSGTVTADGTRAPLSGTTITVNSTGRKATTDAAGHFTLRLPAGR
ncbi:S8 family serine peptidase [Amycolatopsis sp. NPDC051373]|uniref:S8 family serine peptidase n=1 Tax=Amycolatopsis sp. NPDC051373 TaxID=3155801 RepID=UPI00344D1B06